MRNKIDGVLLFNKPTGLSSNMALQKVRRMYNAKKAGHTGTLDPLANGLLIICFGEATKFSSFLLEGDKEYVAHLKLGQSTTTYDTEGEIVFSAPVNTDINGINQCIASFIGNIRQIPPIYSALKVNGKALYEYARNCEEVAIKPRNITIYEIEVLNFSLPDILSIRVFCSKGTYIRSLAHDIGLSLGCGAHLVGLTRTRSNNFMLDDSLDIDKIFNMSYEDRLSLLFPIDVLVGDLPSFALTDEQISYVKNGHQFNAKYTIGKIKLYYKNLFFGIAISDGQSIKPIRLINMVEYSHAIV